jgi:hypothetical protein
LWCHQVDSFLSNINLTTPPSVRVEREAVIKLLNSLGERIEERMHEATPQQLNLPRIEGVSLHAALVREADAVVTQAEMPLQSIPIFCLSPVKVPKITSGTSFSQMNATMFFHGNELLVQNVQPTLPSNALLANEEPSYDVTGKTFDLDDVKTLQLNEETAVENVDVDIADDDQYFNEYVLTGRTIEEYTTKATSDTASYVVQECHKEKATESASAVQTVKDFNERVEDVEQHPIQLAKELNANVEATAVNAQSIENMSDTQKVPRRGRQKSVKKPAAPKEPKKKKNTEETR